jgi:hypothetical protein
MFGGLISNSNNIVFTVLGIYSKVMKKMYMINLLCKNNILKLEWLINETDAKGNCILKYCAKY